MPWKDEIVKSVPLIKDGVFHLPTAPGWGIEIDEEVLKRYPPMKDSSKSGIWSSAES